MTARDHFDRLQETVDQTLAVDDDRRKAAIEDLAAIGEFCGFCNGVINVAATRYPQVGTYLREVPEVSPTSLFDVLEEAIASASEPMDDGR